MADVQQLASDIRNLEYAKNTPCLEYGVTSFKGSASCVKSNTLYIASRKGLGCSRRAGTAPKKSGQKNKASGKES